MMAKAGGVESCGLACSPIGAGGMVGGLVVMALVVLLGTNLMGADYRESGVCPAGSLLALDCVASVLQSCAILGVKLVGLLLRASASFHCPKLSPLAAPVVVGALWWLLAEEVLPFCGCGMWCV